MFRGHNAHIETEQGNETMYYVTAAVAIIAAVYGSAVYETLTAAASALRVAGF